MYKYSKLLFSYTSCFSFTTFHSCNISFYILTFYFCSGKWVFFPTILFDCEFSISSVLIWKNGERWILFYDSWNFSNVRDWRHANTPYPDDIYRFGRFLKLSHCTPIDDTAHIQNEMHSVQGPPVNHKVSASL